MRRTVNHKRHIHNTSYRTSTSRAKKKHAFFLFRLPVVLLVFLLAIIPFVFLNIFFKITRWNPVNTKKLKKINWKKTRFSEVASVYVPLPAKLAISFGKIYHGIYHFMTSLIP